MQLANEAQLIQDCLQQIRSVLTPPPKLTVSEWADQKRVLSSESSAEPGRWNTDRAPYQREIMDTYTHPYTTDITWVASAQVGKTEVINNIAGYAVDQRPGPMLLLQPTLDMAQIWSKTRLAPMARDTPGLSEKIKINSRDGENTILHKQFPGGSLSIAGANSPASLASRPVRDLLADEIDRYPATAGKEGDPLSLGKKRTNNFWNRKRYQVSTPTVAGASRIMDSWEESDQREYYVPCPHCAHMHTLQWANVVWDKIELEDGTTDHLAHTAKMVCPECGGVIEDRHKAVMLSKGRWIAAAEFRGHAGFRINELYSPWRRFRDVVGDFLEAKGDPEKLKVWVNTSLGEPFEDQAGEKVEPDSLLARLEEYRAPVPHGGYVLVAGVDVQDDRLEVQIDAYGDDEESWLVDYVVLYGQPDRQEVWNELDALLLGTTYRHESGVELSISGSNIDSGGHHTQMVYQFCATRYGRRVHAIKGRAGEGIPFVAEAAQKRRGTGARRTPLFLIGVDEGKATLMARLRIDAPGPGFRHYPKGHQNCGPEYFAQLTAEKRVKKFRNGVPFFQWIRTRPRNEALDNTLYSLAAYRMLPKHLVEQAKLAVLCPGQAAPPPRRINRVRGRAQ